MERLPCKNRRSRSHSVQELNFCVVAVLFNEIATLHSPVTYSAAVSVSEGNHQSLGQLNSTGETGRDGPEFVMEGINWNSKRKCQRKLGGHSGPLWYPFKWKNAWGVSLGKNLLVVGGEILQWQCKVGTGGEEFEEFAKRANLIENQYLSKLLIRIPIRNAIRVSSLPLSPPPSSSD